MLAGKNGIIKQVEEAKTETARANFEDRLLLANGEAEMKRNLQGSLSSEEYFEILKNNEIISDTTVGGDNISEPKINEDGSKTYEIMSDDGYVFEATIYPDGKIKTEYQGKKDKLPPKIRKITVINKQTRSFDVNVEVDRLENGTISYYYKEANTNEYIALKEDTKDLTASFTNLEEGKIYNIKVVVENEKGKNEQVINESIKQLVKEIELNETETTVERGQQLQLIATVRPETAENKTIKWSSSDTSVVTVNASGLVQANQIGTATITVKSNENNEIIASCTIKVLVKTDYVADGLILWYDGINNTGTGTEYDGTIYGATWDNDHLSFDGINDYLNVGVIKPQNFTLEVVASVEEDSGEIDFIDNFDGAGCGLFAVPSQKNMAFSIYYGGYKSVYSTEKYELNKKYSISGGYNGTYMYISQNSKIVTQNQTGNIYYSNAPMEIGRNSMNGGVNYCAGIKVYSVRIYNRMLTESEVTKNYNIDKAKFNIR
ncbi:MAG: hypothetical protein HFJ55_01740 [Clostridia bacterium]|nr:hypothetical protein [Clostridia bacterium]